jgi:Ser/Thr protein kinase RdoA (MazF antagonist)
MEPKHNIAKIVPQFSFEGEFIRSEHIGIGHINDTYTANFRRTNGIEHRYILQRINHHVFKNPEEVMANIAAVTTHFRGKITAAGGDPERETLNLIPTKNGNKFYRTGDGYFWRAYIYIENALTYQIPESLQHVYNAARAYGHFQQLLDDFPPDQLHETILDFHNTPKRFDSFVNALEEDFHDRARDAKSEINFVMQRADQTNILVDMLKRDEIPVRVTHNDTKFNNVMIDDETGEGICVIDLDTVMPGSTLYDFGDAIRSITNTAEEDEQDISKVNFSLEIFEKYVHGYTVPMRDTLTKREVEHLAFSARLMTLESGIRFLTDYLNGDTYFRTQRKSQNLDRCKTQFKLVQAMEENYNKMLEIVNRNW